MWSRHRMIAGVGVLLGPALLFCRKLARTQSPKHQTQNPKPRILGCERSVPKVYCHSISIIPARAEPCSSTSETCWGSFASTVARSGAGALAAVKSSIHSLILKGFSVAFKLRVAGLRCPTRCCYRTHGTWEFSTPIPVLRDHKLQPKSSPCRI